MAVKTEWQTTNTPDGEMRIYVAAPDDGNQHPGLVVIQEAFGVNNHIQDVARRYAEQGFVSAAPDLFHRFEHKLVEYSEMQTGMGQTAQMNADRIEMDVRAAVELLNSRADVKRGQIGTIGYCFGGRGSYTAATRIPDLKAAVVYYGGGIAADNPAAPVNESEKIRAPILAFFGEQDQAIPMAQVQKIKDTLSRLGKTHEVHTYPLAGHGFFCNERASYNKEAAEDAWTKTVPFLKKNLGE